MNDDRLGKFLNIIDLLEEMNQGMKRLLSGQLNKEERHDMIKVLSSIEKQIKDLQLEERRK